LVRDSAEIPTIGAIAHVRRDTRNTVEVRLGSKGNRSASRPEIEKSAPPDGVGGKRGRKFISEQIHRLQSVGCAEQLSERVFKYP